MAELNELRLAGRDGTSQAARRLEALDPEYVAVDERGLVELLAYARQHGKRLRYFDADDREDGDWSGLIDDSLDLADVAAFVEDPETRRGDERYTRPHFVLFLAFLKLLQRSQGKLNELTGRHLDFYYRRVLGLRSRPAMADRVDVLLDLAPGAGAARLAAGSLLAAGADSLGKERFYATGREIVVDRAQVAKLSSVHADLRITRVEDVRDRYRNDLATSTRVLLEIALGEPRPGDPLPPYDGQEVELELLRSLRQHLRFTEENLFLGFFELRDLMKLKRRRDAADAEWLAINGYLETAAKTRDPSFALDFAASRSFEENLATAVGGAPSFDGLTQVEDLGDLYDERNREDVKTFIREVLYFEDVAEFEEMMRIKVRIDNEWREIRRILEAAGRRMRSDPGYLLDAGLDPTDFDAILQAAASVAPTAFPVLAGGTGDVGQYYEEVERLETYFSLLAEEFVYLMEVVEKDELATPKEWSKAYRLLVEAHRRKVYAGRREELRQIREDAGFAAAVSHVVGEELQEADTATLLDLLRPLVGTDLGLTFLWDSAEAIAAGAGEVDWPRVDAILEAAWRNREGLPEPLPEKVEWLNLYPAEDAAAVSVGAGIDGGIDRWRTFGRAPLDPSPDRPPAAVIGWAVSSPLLALAEGVRTVQLTLAFRSPVFDGAALAALLAAEQPLSFEASSEKGWIAPGSAAVTGSGTYGTLAGISEPGRKDLEAVQLTLTFGEDAAAIAPPPPAQGGGSQPVLRLTLRPVWDAESGAYRALYPPLRQVRLAAVHLVVGVDGLHALRLQNDDSTLDPARPFEPFGAAPAAGSRLLLGHPELVAKRLDSLTFDVEWMGLPDDLGTHYANYGLGASPSFTTRISLVDRRLEVVLEQQAALFTASPIILAGDDGTGAPAPLYERSAAGPFGEDLRDWDRYLRWELNSPDLQHLAYPAVAAKKAVEMAHDIAKNNVNTNAAYYQVNPPYTPKIKSLKAGYTSSLEIVLDEDGARDPDDQVLHVHPFGYRAAEAERSPDGVALLPGYDGEGELYIGLRDVRAPQNVAVLFQMAEGSAEADHEPAAVSWSYLDGELWRSLDDAGAVLADATRGLVNSGIVELGLPPARPGTLLPGGLYWVRAAVARNSGAVCDTLAVHTQAVAATFVDDGHAADHFSQPLPAGTITRLAEPLPEIAAVRQPYTSRGGRGAEEEGAFATRVSERLRHKGRALTLWDYERLVLDRFPEVYKVKCIPASEPGRVAVVVIPDVRGKLPSDPFEPKAPADLLASIAEHLSARAPAAAAVEVRNAHFVAIKVRCSIRFRGRGNETYYRSLANEELNRYLSPWAYEEGADVAIGARIYADSIVDFLDRRPYVDYVTDVKLFRSDDKETFRLEPYGGEGGYSVAAGRPDGVLVAARRHEIDLIPETGYEESLVTGINYMKLELDFIVA